MRCNKMKSGAKHISDKAIRQVKGEFLYALNGSIQKNKPDSYFANSQVFCSLSPRSKLSGSNGAKSYIKKP